MLKYYSDVTRKFYDTEKDLWADEAKVKKAETEKIAKEKAAKEARSKKAKEVEEALKNANEAQAKAIKLLREFTKEYGYFHTSYSTDDVKPLTNFIDILEDFLYN